MSKLAITNLYYLIALQLLFVTISLQNTNKEIPKFTLVEVNPSALDVMIHAFDQVFIYFHTQSNSETLDTILKNF
jgi:hypothetical protein